MSTTCDRCAYENPPGRDFCLECRNYLRWTLTGETPAIEPRSPAVAAVATQVAPAARAAVDFGALRADGTLGEAPLVSVAPGGGASLTLFVRNRGSLVDHFTLRVDGMPETWWSATPGVAQLVPYGSHGPSERRLTLTFAPPRDPGATAGEWPLRIAVHSRNHGGRLAAIAVTLVIEPYRKLSCSLRPARARGRGLGRFAFSVRNEGNTPAVVALAAHDQERSCRATCEPVALEVPAGATSSSRVTVRPLRPFVVGRAQDRQVLVESSARDGIVVSVGAYRQLPWIPAWLLVLALIIVVLAALALGPVPDLTGVVTSAFARVPRG